MENKESDEDPIDSMLKRTGCAELHYKVQECIAEKRDWRKCQNEVTEFRNCMNIHAKNKQKAKN